MRLIFLFLSLCFFGCFSVKNPQEKRGDILVSIPPYQFLVKEIVQDSFSVKSIVPPKANSHFYEPSPSSFSSLDSAIIWFQIGENFEKKLSSVLKNRFPKMLLENLQEGIPLLSYSSDTTNSCCTGSQDIHTWMSPKLFSMQAKKVEEKLSSLFPEKASFFQNNLKTLLEKLDKLDKKIEEETKHLTKRALLVAHPSFGYFCHDYNFLQISLEWEGKELSLKQVLSLLQALKKEKPALVITMPEHPSKGAFYIAEKLQIPLKEIDPYSENYIETLEELSETLQSL